MSLRGCGSIDCVNGCDGDFTWETCPNVLNRLRVLKAVAETEAAIRLADKALARMGTLNTSPGPGSEGTPPTRSGTRHER